MVLFDPQEAGGLEEYAITLAIGLRDLGHEVSAVSATWTPPTNQYLARLRSRGIPFAQPPKWLSRMGSDWQTKERLLDLLLALLWPLAVILGTARAVALRDTWRRSLASARNWCRAQLTTRLVGPDRRPLLGCLVLAWWRRRWRPDLLHVQGYTRTLLFAVQWAHARALPIVYEEHQTPDPRFDWWTGFGPVVNRADVVLAVSEESKRALHDVCGVTRPIVARPPLLPDPMASGWRRSEARSDDPAVRLTTIARLAETKGLEYLLDAIPLVQATHPATRFRVFGGGPLRDALLARAAGLGLAGEEIFVGPFTSREELSRIMADTDILVMPSVLEGQPVGLIEAMAYACPIVATKVGGIPELIEDGTNGLLCEPRDPAGLADAIVTLIEDEALRRRLGLAARRSYEQGPFQPASVCARVVSIYDDVLRQRTLPLSR